MSSARVSRRGVLINVAVLAIAANPAPGWAVAARDAAVEEFVQVNGTHVLLALGSLELDHLGRSRAFAAAMQDFADFQRISAFVLGRYSAQVRNDPLLLRDWTEAFRAFALANYEFRLDRFRGRTLRVTGSSNRIAGRDVVVTTELVGDAATRTRRLEWRMLRGNSGWKAVDVGVVLNNGDLVWLAQQQQAQFLAELGANGGDIRALIARVRQSTAALAAQTPAN